MRAFPFAFGDGVPIFSFMKKLALIALLAAPLSAFAQEVSQEEDAVSRWIEDHTIIFDAAEVTLDDFIWQARPLVVFAQSPNDLQFQRQMELLEARIDELAERDVVIIVDTDPDTLSDARRALRPRAFMLALVGKDGQIKLRKPAPWDVRELSRSIDKMPMRQQEIRDRRLVDE